ncbi:hypothetical protein K438DRAFT_1802819 [Mycena galopus ATCC 62051]|nr:hypothetical protein K438DRAFT_1802819 [Mycena galopus ATCC 62051]
MTTPAPSSLRTLLTEQAERVRGSSAAQIQELIGESDSKITVIENEMAVLQSSLQSQIAALAERRDRESDINATLRFLVAPIRVLPFETLGEIFLLTICGIDSSRRNIRDVFRVTHVCCHWREVAHSIPRLWTGPVTVTPLRVESKEIRYASNLREWFARSAQLPLPISFAGSIRNWRVDKCPHITEEVLRVASRWRSLRVRRIAPTLFSQRLPELKFDALEELELLEPPNWTDDTDFDPTTISSFTTAPQLRKLTIDLACDIPMPWGQLTEITVHNTDAPPDILYQCTNLVKASLNITGWVSSPTSTHILALDHLRILSVTFAAEQTPGMPFLERLSAPALDELELNFMFPTAMFWDEATFTAFQLRSPNITKLEIRDWGTHAPSNVIIAAFRHAPFLTHLSVDHSLDSVDDALLHALRYTHGVEPLVPRLHSLALTALEAGEMFSEDVLASTIASRCWTDEDLASRSNPPTVVHLGCVKLSSRAHSNFRFSKTFLDAMADLRRTGLDVEIIEVERHPSQRGDNA